MGFISGLALLICGALAASSLIVKRRPDAQQFMDKLLPYQGMFGVVVCLWGIYGTMWSFSTFSWGFMAGLVFLLTGLVSIALGFLLGFALINKWVLSKNEETKAKGEQIRKMLLEIQNPLGLAGIAVGVFCIIASLTWP